MIIQGIVVYAWLNYIFCAIQFWYGLKCSYYVSVIGLNPNGHWLAFAFICPSLISKEEKYLFGDFILFPMTLKVFMNVLEVSHIDHCQNLINKETNFSKTFFSEMLSELGIMLK